MRKRTLKKFAAAVIAGGFVINSYAVAPGFYMGLMTGPATSNGSTVQVETAAPLPRLTPPQTTPATPRSTQYGTRVYMGYKINKYAGFEGGLDYFSTVSYNTKNVPTCSGVKARVRGLDIVGKGEFPLGDFAVFGKAGAAAVYKSTSGAMNPNSNLLPNGNYPNCGSTQYSNKVVPTVAIGASYDFNQSWVGDISWTKIMVGNPLSTFNLFALGISYHFVDVYCGQFLC